MTLSISMADYLKVVIPHIPSELVPLEALSKIQTLAQCLPPCSVGLFECHLDKNQFRVDFQVRSSCISFKMPESLTINPLWSTGISFGHDWSELKTHLCQMIDYIWLEFDLMGSSSLLPIPCIFFTLNQGCIDYSKLQEIAIKFLIKLLNLSFPLRIEPNLKTCIESLPKEAQIAHVGAMLSRPTKAVRLVIKKIPPQRLSDYLEQIGWQDPTNMLPQLVSNLSNWVNSVALAFDVSEKIYPRIGLECFLNQQPFIDEASWQSFLDNYLMKEGLCTSTQANALLAWPGFSQKLDQPELWPSHLKRLDHLLSPNAISLFYRTINHLKIVYQPGSPLVAKAYLAFFHSYLEYPA
jgi:hypothetical protein